MEPTERIEGIELFGRGQQRLLLMLTMDINEGAPELFEHTEGAEAAVEVHPMAAGSREDTPKNQFGLVLTDEV